ncbi:unnamed protein product [Cylicostephanus goldi]|uniref:LNS2/PITP domain-containing protein n=1 Tax=Cylicostephanus goldi TaxID=71465 RepID=A0A3P7MHQ3_CYLGO|nr:unnamed protein product [Cylicostephanus goldi]
MHSVKVGLQSVLLKTLDVKSVLQMVVHGDRSYLDSFVAVVPSTTQCVVFSVDGSLTASVSGFVILYLTARPDMQQRVVSAWLAQHCFPHDMGIKVHAAYGSSKSSRQTFLTHHLQDVAVYCSAGVEQSRIVSVAGSRRRNCIFIGALNNTSNYKLLLQLKCLTSSYSKI